MRLEGKVAIVTGGGRGLGQLYCLRLAEEGAKVVAADIIDVTDTVKQIEDRGGTAMGLKVDVSSEEDTLRLAAETVKRFGRIDILINNAAIYYGVGLRPFYEIGVKEWDREMEVNVKGSWLCAKAVFPQMKKQGKGNIINISSGTIYSGTPGFLHYVTSKAAIIGLTHGMATELGGHGIRVNALAPGYTMTEASKILMPEERQVRAVQHRCLKRPEEPEDLVGAIIFLASDESEFMTGQTLLVDGGATLH